MISDIVSILVLILLKGILAAISTSFSILEIKNAKYFSDKDNKNYDKLMSIMQHSRQDINVASVLNAFIGVLIGFILALHIYTATSDMLALRYSTLANDIISIVSAVVVIVVTTYAVSLFGLVFPKIIADKYPDKIVLIFDGVLHFIAVLLSPFMFFINVAIKILGLFVNVEDDDISEEEILMMVDAGGEQGSIDEKEMEMINNIFDFDDKNVSEIATHRKDISAVPVDITLDELLDVISDVKFSRIPVYEEDIDNIIGILHVKDIINVLLKNDKDKFNIKDLIREPYFVPATKKTDALFAEMKNNKIHMAVVADEYGGTVGIVTMEDLIEEVMGEIQDEYDDEEEPEIKEVNDNVTKIEGSADLEDVAESLDIEMPVDEYDTLGGFLIAQLDRVPEDGEKGIVVEYKNCIFSIDKIEDKRIVSVTVTQYDTESEE